MKETKLTPNASCSLQLFSLEDTNRLAEILASFIEGKSVTILLNGDLGAGKTAFARCLGKAMGVTRTINSPTFNIMKSYPAKDGKMFYHIDAYRLEEGSSDLGFEECFEEGICAVEWPQYIMEQIPQEHLSLSLCEQEDESRTAVLCANGGQYAPMIEKVREAFEHASSRQERKDA